MLNSNDYPHTYWVKEGGSWRNLENSSVRIKQYGGYGEEDLAQIGDIGWSARGACLKLHDGNPICFQVPYEEYTMTLREDIIPDSAVLFLGKGSEFPTSPPKFGRFIKDGKAYLYGENFEWGGT